MKDKESRQAIEIFARSAQKKIESLETEVTSLKRKNTALESTLASLHARMDLLMNMFARHGDEIEGGSPE